MPELRKDLLTDHWVIIATERGKRPHEFKRADNNRPQERHKETCVFCYGNEDKTPPEVLAYRTNGQGSNQTGWSVRVVPNKFPALQIEGELRPPQSDGLFHHMNGIGAHEVIIESPDHSSTFGSHTDEQMERILYSFRERFLELKKDQRFKYVQLFKNSGVAAGASLEHTHSQLIAVPMIPARLAAELNGARQFYQQDHECPFCKMLRKEERRNERVIEVSGYFIALTPYASRVPYEVWILPREHQAHFEAISEEQVSDLARLMRRTVKRLEVSFDYPPYNMVLDTAPFEPDHESYYHWRFEFIPRLTTIAGFELGTWYFINPTPPEMAAAVLKEVDIDTIHIPQEPDVFETRYFS